MGLATQASPVATHLLVCLHSLLLLHPSKSNLFFPLLLFLSIPDISRFKISLVRNQALRWVYINHALDILLGQKPFFVLPPIRLGIQLLCWIICNDGQHHKLILHKFASAGSQKQGANLSTGNVLYWSCSKPN